MINQTSMCADDGGHPYIATYWTPAGSHVPQYQLVWYTGSQWNNKALSSRTAAFSLSGGGTKKIPISWPQIFLGRKGRKQAAFLVFRDEELGNHVTVALCKDFPSQEWQMKDLSVADMGSWEPSYDTELWKNRQELNLFVEYAEQGDGEGLKDTPPQMISVLEWKP